MLRFSETRMLNLAVSTLVMTNLNTLKDIKLRSSNLGLWSWCIILRIFKLIYKVGFPSKVDFKFNYPYFWTRKPGIPTQVSNYDDCPLLEKWSNFIIERKVFQWLEDNNKRVKEKVGSWTKMPTIDHLFTLELLLKVVETKLNISYIVSLILKNPSTLCLKPSYERVQINITPKLHGVCD